MVGTAGGADKCRYVEEELGFDLCLDRHQPDLAGRPPEACPSGVDVYVELVGGDLFWAVLPLLNLHARIPVIGSISWYNLERPPEGPDRTPRVLRAALTRRLRIEGFLILDHAGLVPEFRGVVASLVSSGRLRFKEGFGRGPGERACGPDRYACGPQFRQAAGPGEPRPDALRPSTAASLVGAGEQT